jgi:hypothetical protein
MNQMKISEKVADVLSHFPFGGLLVRKTQHLANNWRAGHIPAQQRSVVDKQISAMRSGDIDPVFASCIAALKAVKLESFSLLDGACASGYYSDVLQALDPRAIEYY